MPKKTKDRTKEFPTSEQIITSQLMTGNNSPLKFEVEHISVEAAEKLLEEHEKNVDRKIPTWEFIVSSGEANANRLEVRDLLKNLADYIYGHILTADQYNLVMDLMREFTYHNSYQLPATCSERLNRIQNSLKTNFAP